MFEKCMKIPDSLLLDYYRLTTDIPSDIYKPLVETDIRKAHFEYARAIVSMYHSVSAALRAEERYRQIASGANPDDMSVYELGKEDLQNGGIRLVELIKNVGFASSLREARRNIIGKGIKINGSVVEDADLILTRQEPFVIQFGKNKFVKIIIK